MVCVHVCVRVHVSMQVSIHGHAEKIIIQSCWSYSMMIIQLHTVLIGLETISTPCHLYKQEIFSSTWKGWIQLLSALFWTGEKTKLRNCSKGDKFSECLWAKATVKEADFLLCKDQTNAKLSHCFRIELVIWFHCNTEGTELYAPNPRYLNLFLLSRL